MLFLCFDSYMKHLSGSMLALFPIVLYKADSPHYDMLSHLEHWLS